MGAAAEKWRTSPVRSRPYRRIAVKQVDVARLVAGRDAVGVDVGVDISKGWVDSVARWEDGRFEQPWRAANPGELRLLIDRLGQLGRKRRLAVAMESSGTYGEPLRQGLTQAGICVGRVGGKAVHDYHEIFDGVPSSHDGKSAAVIAELAAMGKATPWPHSPATAFDEQLGLYVDRLDAYQKVVTAWTNRVEAQLALHWPEATGYLRPSSPTLLRVLAGYGGPSGLAAAGSAGLRQVRQWGGHYLKADKARALVRSAGESMGVGETAVTRERLRSYAQEALSVQAKVLAEQCQLKRLAGGHEVLSAQRPVAGLGVAAVAWVDVGDPSHYGSAAAYRKAMGLNLKERSSGQWQGRLKISKRGSPRVRRWLYYAALRLTMDEAVQPWYTAKKAQAGGGAGQALTAIMRKLALALYHVGARGARYDVNRLFAVSHSKAGRGAGVRR